MTCGKPAAHACAIAGKDAKTGILADAGATSEQLRPAIGDAAPKQNRSAAAETRPPRRPVVAVLALQGAFAEHERKLAQAGADCVELRQRADLKRPFDALVLPGGESTAQGKLLRDLGMLEPLRERIIGGLPVLATCAGMILLAERIAQGDGPHLATVPMTVRRNAYGRQLESFRAEGELTGVGRVPMTFIRAPYVEKAGPGTEVLARVDGRIVAVRCGAQWALAFHPELDAGCAVHAAFLSAALRPA
ncbi:pyridoxal 5'-phosphate synthase glutaminase subunit PdxT [Rubneribacter sp.]